MDDAHDAIFLFAAKRCASTISTCLKMRSGMSNKNLINDLVIRKLKIYKKLSNIFVKSKTTIQRFHTSDTSEPGDSCQQRNYSGGQLYLPQSQRVQVK
jgi:hypothetical protein